MFVTTFAAFAASSIIFMGTIAGPDYRMTIDPEGRAHVEFSDGTSANVQFNTVFVFPDDNIARGVVVNTTAPTRMLTGDTVNLSTNLRALTVLRPDLSIRMNEQACWAGFNRAPDQQVYPCR